MAKKLSEIKIDGISFNVDYWGEKTVADFEKEATAEGAAMIPNGVRESDKPAWIKTAHDLIAKAYGGDETVKPYVNTEDLKAEEPAKKGRAKAEKPE